MVIKFFAINQFNTQTSRGVTTASPFLVPLETMTDVVRFTDVERPIGTPQDVHEVHCTDDDAIVVLQDSACLGWSKTMSEAALRRANWPAFSPPIACSGHQKKCPAKPGNFLVEAAGVETRIGRFSNLLMARDF